MSHITQMKTKIKDLICLKEALNDLGYKIEQAKEGQKIQIRGWNNARQEADVRIKTNCSYDIGLIKKDNGQYEILADWWGLETRLGTTREKIVNPILQHYSYKKVMKEARKMGYKPVEEKKENNTLKIKVRKWS